MDILSSTKREVSLEWFQVFTASRAWKEWYSSRTCKENEWETNSRKRTHSTELEDTHTLSLSLSSRLDVRVNFAKVRCGGRRRRRRYRKRKGWFVWHYSVLKNCGDRRREGNEPWHGKRGNESFSSTERERNELRMESRIEPEKKLRKWWKFERVLLSVLCTQKGGKNSKEKEEESEWKGFRFNAWLGDCLTVPWHVTQPFLSVTAHKRGKGNKERERSQTGNSCSRRRILE